MFEQMLSSWPRIDVLIQRLWAFFKSPPPVYHWLIMHIFLVAGNTTTTEVTFQSFSKSHGQSSKWEYLEIWSWSWIFLYRWCSVFLLINIVSDREHLVSGLVISLERNWFSLVKKKELILTIWASVLCFHCNFLFVSFIFIQINKNLLLKKTYISKLKTRSRF